jgi:TolB-like protein/DNA-binding winged helix-turn-helix (wHTH) protein/tetratricopeptide (TPR) repeat protein
VDREAGFRLGSWDVRPNHGTLQGPGGTIRLEPKVMDVLVCLAERAGDVVTREQFIQRVWGGRVVTDEVLSRCISLLRTHLGDDTRAPQYIQTVPKIGYRIIAPVLPRAEQASAGPASTRAPSTTGAPGAAEVSRRYPRWLLPTLAALVIGVIAIVLLAQRTPAPPSGQVAIAVLPFANVSGDPANEYFSDGLTEELIDRLARAPGLQVVARSSAFSLKNGTQDVRAIAQRLGVTYVIEGSVRKDGEQVRITAQLIDAQRGFELWSERFDSRLHDIFTVQDEIAGAIVGHLLPRLSARDAAGMQVAPPTRVMPAYELLLRGSYHLKQRDEVPIRRAMVLFEQAVELDPVFAQAYVELARAHALLPYYSYEDVDEMFDRAVATIERGAARNPAVRAGAQDVLAFIHFGRWQWIEAEEGMRRALRAQPQDSELRQWYSQLLASVGNAPQSLEHAKLARQLDVLSPVVNDRLAVAYLWMNEDSRAHAQFALASELGMRPAANPEAHVILLLREGDHAKAREILVALQKLFGRSEDWIDPFLAALRAPAGRPAAVTAVARAAERHAISPQHLFGAWVYLGEADRAMEVALQMVGEPAEFNVEFLFARETALLRRHARFGELVRAIGLDKYWDRYGWPPMCARKGNAIACT